MNEILKKWESGKIDVLFYSLLHFSFVVYTLFSGASNISRWWTGLTFFATLCCIYIFLKERFKNVGFFLSLLFMAFWLIPTVEFILYENNPKNYRVSENFKNSEAILAKDKLKGQLGITDLDKILLEMNKISKESLAKRKPESTMDDITGMVNIYRMKVLKIPEPIKLNIRKKFSIIMGKIEIDLIKNKSTKTTLFLKTDFPELTDNEIIESLNRKREEQLLLMNLKSGLTRIPYSEFLIDAVSTFSSDDISPSRNLPKALNGLQALIMVLLTSIIINSFGIGLTMTRKDISEPDSADLQPSEAN